MIDVSEKKWEKRQSKLPKERKETGEDLKHTLIRANVQIYTHGHNWSCHLRMPHKQCQRMKDICKDLTGYKDVYSLIPPSHMHGGSYIQFLEEEGKLLYVGYVRQGECSGKIAMVNEMLVDLDIIDSSMKQ